MCWTFWCQWMSTLVLSGFLTRIWARPWKQLTKRLTLLACPLYWRWLCAFKTKHVWISAEWCYIRIDVDYHKSYFGLLLDVTDYPKLWINPFSGKGNGCSRLCPCPSRSEQKRLGEEHPGCFCFLARGFEIRPGAICVRKTAVSWLHQAMYCAFNLLL